MDNRGVAASINSISVVPVLSGDPLSQARELFREYGRLPGVTPCVQDFEAEIAALPGKYAPPGGRLLLAVPGTLESSGNVIGCGALRPWEEDACEMKRVFVRPAFRGSGAGRALVNELIAQARTIGYRRMLLDTLPWMKEAHSLYRAIGFREIPSYQKNPIAGALFFELQLR
jgi:putative acetyltransferase